MGDIVAVFQVNHNIVTVEDYFVAAEAAPMIDFFQGHKLSIFLPVSHNRQPMVLLCVTSHCHKFENLATNLTTRSHSVFHVVAVFPVQRHLLHLFPRLLHRFESPPIGRGKKRAGSGGVVGFHLRDLAG